MIGGLLKKSLFVFLFVLFIVGQNAHGQYYFGRNKIQYNNFEWYVLKTEHFDIYYYPEMRELAEIGAAYAEETYHLLEDKFNHNILRRIPLIFYATHAHFQETNTIPYIVPEGVGGFFEFLKGRVVVPANGSVSQFKRVLRHELVHVFTHSKTNRILKDHKQLNHPGTPLWFTEGLAEYWSRAWDSEAEMFIRDAVLNDYLFPLSRMYQITGSFLMYKEGQNVLKYISETYGDEKLLQLIDNIWMSRQFSEVMKVTLGKNYKELDKEWIYALKKETYPLLEHYDSASMVTRQITKKGINIKPAYYLDDDQEKVVFISNRTGYSNIYLKSLAPEQKKKQKAKILVAGERTSEFESFHLLSSKIDVNKDGELAFISKSGESDRLYIYNIAEEEITDQLHFKNLVSLFSPSWSPDNEKIVFSGLAFSGKCDLYIYDRLTGTLTQVTNDYYDDRDPVWSPDGRLIAFSSDRSIHGADGYYNLFTYDTETGLIYYVTNGPYNDKTPSWSIDGKYLAFSSDRSGTYNIWILKTLATSASRLLASVGEQIPSDEKNGSWPPFATTAIGNKNYLKQLTFFTTGAFDPEWTKDGNLLFTAFEKFSFQIHLFDKAAASFDSLQAARPDTLQAQKSQWTFAKINGKTGEGSLKYKPKYDLDVAQSQITQDPIFGTSGGMQLAISDMLGNYQYFFLLYNTARTRDEFLESFNFAVSRVDLSHRTNFALGIYHFAGRFYNLYDYWFWERRYGGFGALSYPFSTFQRIEASLNVRSSDKEWFTTGYRRKALLVSNFVAYIKDNSLWGPTGPIDGERINITLGNTMDVVHSNVNFITAIIDYRRYFRISPRVSHAVRFWTQINHGKESTPFFMGGSWDLRGYRFWRLWGTKLVLLSNELRFPFIDQFVINFPFGGLGFSAIRGAAFFDIGNAWDEELPNLLGSTGFGIRFRFGGMLVLRFDVGRKFVLEEPAQFYNRNNYKFDKKWFTQFFFGWDF